MSQTRHSHDTAMPVCGVDAYRRFGAEDLDPIAPDRRRELDRQVRETMGEKSCHP